MNIQTATHFMYNFHRASLRPAEDASKLPKFLSVHPVLRPRQQFVVPIGVQVIFALGLNSRQNSSAFIHLAVALTYVHLEIIFIVRLWLERTMIYSYRSATMGSTRIARRAGIQQARPPTAISSAIPPAKVQGSLGATP